MTAPSDWTDPILPTLRTAFHRRLGMALATPWDRFKARWFPNWLLTLCPVRWVRVSSPNLWLGQAVMRPWLPEDRMKP